MAKKHWIQDAEESMEARGTKGKFGKATPSKIAKAKAHGGLQAKRANFAANMAKLAKKRSRRSGRR